MFFWLSASATFRRSKALLLGCICVAWGMSLALKRSKFTLLQHCFEFLRCFYRSISIICEAMCCIMWTKASPGAAPCVLLVTVAQCNVPPKAQVPTYRAWDKLKYSCNTPEILRLRLDIIDSVRSLAPLSLYESLLPHDSIRSYGRGTIRMLIYILAYLRVRNLMELWQCTEGSQQLVRYFVF